MLVLNPVSKSFRVRYSQLPQVGESMGKKFEQLLHAFA